LIKELKWDSKLFGRKMGRLTGVTSNRSLRNLIDRARKDNYQHLSCRFTLERMAEVQQLERFGFYLTDLGVVWEKKTVVIPDRMVSARKAAVKDVAMLKEMSRGLFTDGRFYNDPFFTRHEADRLYQAWIDNALREKDVQTFVVADKGFIVCKRLSKYRGDIPLVGVIAGEQGKGIGSGLVKTALNWFKTNGIRTVTVRTQANNVRAMNFYKGLGFVVKYTDVTMGKILATEDIQ
jgi:GNAT superfamily N-acetyltransferase